MKNISLALTILVFSMTSYAFNGKAVIEDSDGYVNVRAGRSSKDSVIARIENNEWFHYATDCSGDWWKVMTQGGKQGYVHKSRIKPFRSPHEKTHTYRTERNGNRATIEIVENAFSCSGHEVKSDEKGYSLIDGRSPRGTDGTMPITEIKKMIIEWNGKTFEVDRKIYEGCFNPFFDENNFYFAFSEDSSTLLAFLSASDGAGVYGVMWIFRDDGKNSRLFAGYGDCTMFDTWCHEEP